MFKNKTVFITGATRGIGREIALHFAKQHANVVITGKTQTANPKLPGTIHSVAEEVEKLGGKALPILLDVRDVENVHQAFEAAAIHFGGIDILINNASAIHLANTEAMTDKRFDLMMACNVRGTFFSTQAALPFLKKAKNPHVINLSPPLNLNPKWFKDHLAYTYSKYGMSFCTLGMAEEFKPFGIAVNSLWPQTTIATAAIAVHFPPEILAGSRKPAIMADAVLHLVQEESKQFTGQFLIDETYLKEKGVVDFSQYACQPGTKLYTDFFIDA